MAAFPITREDGSLRGVVLASIRVEWIAEFARTVARRPGTSVLVIDGSGTLIGGSPDAGEFVGKNFAGHALTREMLRNDEGTTTVAGFDGVRRIFGHVRVPVDAMLGWRSASTKASCTAASTARSASPMCSLPCSGCLFCSSPGSAASGSSCAPIRALVRTAARFGRGDLHVRAGDEPWLAEFQPLAAALDDMAHKLAGREEELRVANQHLDALASLDGLTGLANRRGFDRALERAWQHAGERREPLALMMIDIDHFKLFNDRYGHVSGDTCLRAVGETLSLVLLDEAVLVARYGGEEFALLLPGLDISRATALADEARGAIEDLLITHAESPCGHVTVSVGVESIVPAPGQAAADLVEAADRALYAAKRRGRNTVIAHVPMVMSAA